MISQILYMYYKYLVPINSLLNLIHPLKNTRNIYDPTIPYATPGHISTVM
jgi:hypothetical protein